MTNKKRLFEYLSSYDILFLSTADNNPSACVVYYGIDEDFTIYIVTPPTTEHGKNMVKNGNIAGVVTDTNQQLFQTKYKIAAQIKGNGKEVTDEKEIMKGLLIWARQRKDVAENFFNGMKDGSKTSRVFIIRPTEIKWFNEERYGPEGTELFSFKE